MESKQNKQKTKKPARAKKAAAKPVKKAAKTAEGSDAQKEHAIPMYDSKGKSAGSFKLDKRFFTGEVNKDVLYQFVRMYNANQRQGTASTKTRGDVSGGGKKPWRQKGTGRARAGSTRSPLWRHGGVIFGPHPRDYHYSIPKKVKRLAFLSSLNSKLKDSKFMGIEAVVIDEPKTKKFMAIMEAMKLAGKSLLILDNVENNVRLASRNLADVVVKNYKDFNTMDVLVCENLVMSKAALEKLAERIAD